MTDKCLLCVQGAVGTNAMIRAQEWNSIGNKHWNLKNLWFYLFTLK